MHERCHVCRLLKNFCIRVIVDKGQKLVKDPLNVSDFFKIARDHGHFGKQALLFASELFVEFRFQLHFFLIKLPVEVRETLIDIFELLLL